MNDKTREEVPQIKDLCIAGVAFFCKRMVFVELCRGPQEEDLLSVPVLFVIFMYLLSSPRREKSCLRFAQFVV